MRSSRQRILITGGAGFIGSHLVDALLASGDGVTVLDDLSTGKAEHLAGHTADGLRTVWGSVLDAELVDALVEEQDQIYHLAAAVGVRNVINDPVGSMLTNVRGTENVLAAALERGIPVLLASTSEIYGRNTTYPFHEDSDRVLGPTWIQRWSYSTAKAIDEHLAFAYAEKGLAVSIVRYFNSYGPRIDERGYGSVIARFTRQALAGEPITVHGDGAQTRCFTYVNDTVRGTRLAAAAASPGTGRVFNIGSSEEVSIGEIAALIRDVLGSSSDIVLVPYESYYGPGFEDTRRRVPDVRRAEQDLGFRAEIGLRQGLTWTLEWCRANYSVAGVS